MEDVRLLRRFLAMLKYRCAKAIVDAPANYPKLDVISRPIMDRAGLMHFTGWGDGVWMIADGRIVEVPGGAVVQLG